MSERSMKTLDDIAKELQGKDNKITLMYAFNATGKTRLSVKFKELVNMEARALQADMEVGEQRPLKILYFNAFTEDLFTWENEERKLIINTDSVFIDLVQNQGKELEIASRFRKYISNTQEDTLAKIEPVFDLNAGEVRFNLVTGDEVTSNIKISKGEESIFIWSIFYTLIETIIEERNIAEITDRSTDLFNQMQYIFIDDPISSLDDNHVIDVAVDLIDLLNRSEYSSSTKTALRFIISTHHPLFYNVLYNEFRKKQHCYLLKRSNINQYELVLQSDSPFGYHLTVAQTIQNAIDNEKIERYHFALLRNLLEKTATYLGYERWQDCIAMMYPNITDELRKSHERRINLYTHNLHSALEPRALQSYEQDLFENLFKDFKTTFQMKVSD
ncbi:MAG: AAA family ATPase [Defluviitaleaceae bacterium]|nr:AAA family ATPase [Defluviitaleaceae bacterium]